MNICEIRRTLAMAMMALTLTASPAWAWLSDGHKQMTRTAVAAMPESLPAFFRQGAETIAGTSVDPDAFRSPMTRELTVAEAPEHFFDLEMLQDHPIPPNRYAFVALCAGMKIEPGRVGMLPYAITEWAQRLAVAFAEVRRHPDDAGAQARCLVYAGILAHYAEDLSQPLHVTIHYDGRAERFGQSPHSGIHMRVDALAGRLGLNPTVVGRTLEAHVLDAILPAVIEEMKRSNALVDRVYDLEKDMPPAAMGTPPDADWTASPAVRKLGEDQFRAGARMTASLYMTAWELSAKLTLPEWAGGRRPSAATPETGK